MAMKVTGLDKVLKRINKTINKIEGGTIQGLLEAAVLVKAESIKLTPIDTGNLRASSYILWGGGKTRTKGQSNPTFKTVAKGKRGSAERFGNIARLSSEHSTVVNMRKGILRRHPFAEIGYTAHYAAPVHEAVNRNFRVGGAKFLEQALINNSRNIFRIIRRRAKIL